MKKDCLTFEIHFDGMHTPQLLNKILFLLYLTNVRLRNIFFNHLFVNLFWSFFFVSSSSLQHYNQQLNKIQCSCMTIINYLVGVRAYLRIYGNEFFNEVVIWEYCLSFSLVIKSIVDFFVSRSMRYRIHSFGKKNSSSYRVYLLEQNWAKEKNSFFFFFSFMYWSILFNLLFSVRSVRLNIITLNDHLTNSFIIIIKKKKSFNEKNTFSLYKRKWKINICYCSM
jgi:hypothetical protein